MVVWFVAQKWLLPKLGISTWMSPNACRVSTEENKTDENKIEEKVN